MIYESQKKELRKYRHIIAALIAQSEGYFTPLYALEAIEAYKKKESFGCEWYYHIADICFGDVKDRYSDENFKEINTEVICCAIKSRRRRKLKQCLAIVDKNIEGKESAGASWF